MILLATLLVHPAAAFGQQAETIEYYGQDVIGSIRIVFAPNGEVLGRQDYEPFGRPLFTVPTISKENFSGQESDGETAESNFHARSLQVRLGRFAQPDPVDSGLLTPQRWNRYAYALNAPLVYTDPTGLVADSCETDLCEDVIAKASWVDFNNQMQLCFYTPSLCGWGLYSSGGGTSWSYGEHGGGGRFIPPSGTGGTATGQSPAVVDAPGGQKGIPEPDGKEPISSVNRCAAALGNRYNLAAYFNFRSDNYAAQSLLGNDAATISNIVTGTDRPASVGSLTLSNPSPWSVWGALFYATGKLGWNTGALDIATNGAGQAYARGTIVTDLAKTGLGKLGSGFLSGFTGVKAVADVGVYVGALYVCAAK
jgi:RHS repeat-associated protein